MCKQIEAFAQSFLPKNTKSCEKWTFLVRFSYLKKCNNVKINKQTKKQILFSGNIIKRNVFFFVTNVFSILFFNSGIY